MSIHAPYLFKSHLLRSEKKMPASWSLKFLPIGTAYAVWTGIGAAGTAILGMIIFKDPVSIARITAIAFIIFGVILLNFSSSSH
jgi:quaternary ammonium compound-resistance protein SugE